MIRNVSSKKRPQSDGGLFDLVVEMDKVGVTFQKIAEGVAMFFKTEAECNDKKVSIFKEITEIGNIPKDDMLVASEYIIKEAHKVDFFFLLPKDSKKDYVLKQQLECNLY
ncbi:hypothetical protein V6N11_051210 [Hibiscus sabdariffa]|uniref:Uncharacterized protein n=2 Tax=Hibiscus sabdariffa TaxID=183260 RepID=A0ABR2N8U0_9ROSI